MKIAVLGIDLGKSTFHLCGQDRAGHVLLRRKLSRSQLFPALVQLPQCLIVMEACAGAHYLACKLTEIGHKPKLNAAQYVKGIRTTLLMPRSFAKRIFSDDKEKARYWIKMWSAIRRIRQLELGNGGVDRRKSRALVNSYFKRCDPL